ncbi:MAG: rod-binding protein [Acidobacteriaceae bacterium]|nr:rod-binding protein [Acidobacteriaceae bacterium]
MTNLDATTSVLAGPAELIQKKPEKIHDAAQQFEALMIGEMLKSVRESSSDGWLGSGDSDASDSAESMAETQFASALAAGGGIGLAKMIESNLTKAAAAQNVTASSGFSHPAK